MAERYLIDTSVVIKFLNQTLPETSTAFIDAVLDEESNISFISEIELQAWNPPAEDDLIVYRQFVQSSHVFTIDEEITTTTIYLRRTAKLKIADAIIAATAITNNFTLIADNDKDFLKVEGLKYFNPYHNQ